MDPDETLDHLITAILAGQYIEAANHLDDLEIWATRGGFAPRDPRLPSPTEGAPS